MTARHSAAVARYAKSIAEELGLDDDQQDLAHTAGLLHDIGKFIFPDNILRRPQAHRGGLGDRQEAPRPGRAARPRASTGTARSRTSSSPTTSGSTAPATRTTCPARNPADSRMISVADTFDVMTARDSLPPAGPPLRGDRRAARASPARSSTATSSRLHPRCWTARSSRSSTPPTPISRLNWASRPEWRGLHAARCMTLKRPRSPTG